MHCKIFTVQSCKFLKKMLHLWPVRTKANSKECDSCKETCKWGGKYYYTMFTSIDIEDCMLCSRTSWSPFISIIRSINAYNFIYISQIMSRNIHCYSSQLYHSFAVHSALHFSYKRNILYFPRLEYRSHLPQNMHSSWGDRYMRGVKVFMVTLSTSSTSTKGGTVCL